MINAIREITQNDLPTMMDIWNQNHLWLTSTEMKHSLDSLSQWYLGRKESGHDYFGYFAGDRLIGFIIILSNARELWLKMIAFVDTERRKGYGSYLVKRILSEYSEEFESIFSEVKWANIPAINFMFRNGFRLERYNQEDQEFIFKYHLVDEQELNL